MTEQANNTQQSAPFEIKKIYLKDASLESPMSPVVFTQEYKPSINVEFDNQCTKLDFDQNTYEVTVRITVTAKNEAENKVYFVSEVKYAGVFMINLEGDSFEQCSEAFCPGILFPYASAQVCDLIVKGGFPPVNLPPVNFDALLVQKKNSKQNNA